MLLALAETINGLRVSYFNACLDDALGYAAFPEDYKEDYQ